MTARQPLPVSETRADERDLLLIPGPVSIEPDVLAEVIAVATP